MNIVINLDKPEHITSQQAVTTVKRLFDAKKAGHTGTLDPIATGVLIVCLNEATKITRFLSDFDKEYIVQLKLGERTDTYDSTGRIVEKKDSALFREEDLREVLSRFTGDIEQTPPMYSAVKIGGERLYKLARKGISIERPVRNVHIHQIELLSYHHPYVNVRVTCSKGTYIRTLCDDIGIALGTRAHMTALKRSQVHNFRIEDSVSIAELPEPGRKKCFYSMDQALSDLEEITLDHDSWYRLKNGQPMRITGDNTEEFLQNMCKNTHNISSGDCHYVRLKSSDNILLGIGTIRGDSLRVERLFNAP